MLSEFAEKWNLKIEGERIHGCYGFIMECNGELWCWTHSHTSTVLPSAGHKFFPIRDWADEIEAMYFMLGED